MSDQDQPVETMEIRALKLGDSPRLSGENVQHTRALLEAHTVLPPIVVHRPTMRVLDGLHRVRAATLRGDTEIEAYLFDGTEDDAFVLAVEANVAHGLPLAPADRTAAAARIIRSHPQWSDRAIAVKTGLAAKTIGALRGRATADLPQLHSRVGRDGRIRPLDTEHGRRVAGELIVSNPGASLREIAKAAGISPGTVRDVRNRLRRNEDPVPTRSTGSAGPAERHPAPRPVRRTSFGELESNIKALQRDPSLRLTVAGRFLLRLFTVSTIRAVGWRHLAATVPDHWSEQVADAAEEYSEAWQEFAKLVRDRGSATLSQQCDDELAESAAG